MKMVIIILGSGICQTGLEVVTAIASSKPDVVVVSNTVEPAHFPPSKTELPIELLKPTPIDAFIYTEDIETKPEYYRLQTIGVIKAGFVRNDKEKNRKGRRFPSYFRAR